MAPPIAVSVAPAVDAGVPPITAPSGVRARGELSVSFLSETGGYSGSSATPDPTDTVRPCYARALRDDPSLVGWIRVRVAGAQGPASFEAELLDSSDLPASLTSCVVAAIRTLRANHGEWVPPRIAYVSLR